MNQLSPVFASLREAQKELALQSRAQKDAALLAAAAAVNEERGAILAANAADTAKARAGGMKDALIDRLFLNEKRLDEISAGIEAVVRLEDPCGRVRAGWKTPAGLFIEQLTVPLGVAAIIYESRPNVTADAASLAYKAGCAILLRGSSAALESNKALAGAFKRGLEAGGGLSGAVELAAGGRRDEVDEILSARGCIDVVLPRGGRDLIRRVVDNARVPVIETGEGNCHIYVEESADMDTAAAIVENAKIQKPGACNAAETLIVRREALPALMARLVPRLAGKVELRCDPAALSALREAAGRCGAPDSGAIAGAYNGVSGKGDRAWRPETATVFGNSFSAPKPRRGGSEEPAPVRSGGETSPALVIREAVEEDWAAEFLDYILAVKTVDSLDEAIEHINRYGTRHSEAILTNNLKNAEEFCRRVDAACVYVNASTRFTDGGEFGFGAELGISTQKFHARGPMGLEALTTIKYRVSGNGQVRE